MLKGFRARIEAEKIARENWQKKERELETNLWTLHQGRQPFLVGQPR